jgi:hypothetical protein
LELSSRDQYLLDHYVRYLGPYAQIITDYYSSPLAPDPIISVVFAPNDETPDWLYVTIGMSRLAMTGREPHHRIELML